MKLILCRVGSCMSLGFIFFHFHINWKMCIGMKQDQYKSAIIHSHDFNQIIKKCSTVTVQTVQFVKCIVTVYRYKSMPMDASDTLRLFVIWLLPAIFESGNIFFTSGPMWSATAIGMLCSTRKSTASTSAFMTLVSLSSVRKPAMGLVDSIAALYDWCLPVLVCFSTSWRPPCRTLKSALHNIQ